ncbi:NAD(P)-dependent oxidoreductase [Geodermatophilus sp. YIM 151500]|uniref:NAD(P)-dependent oxidoreductase n=1 Tax=Geodermatophilus sp. YIM 151500 TaxID=2984531 RepID=UPI0021E4CDF2|nr:NAD(P)-dependent oxidoreductase [Geodermatophilus sp. YIM 151500]MCV2488901.1 NAD(P)-dependent oxidoreductase [Geodermatophilus sp. YIM 151500]
MSDTSAGGAGDGAAPVVAVLGAGAMGAGMVRSLRRAQVPVRVWNRDAAKAEALAGSGAEVCATPADAVAGADVVLTVLLDAEAVLDTVRRAAPAAGTVWLQCATVGLDGFDRTADLARELDLVLVDCPVLGTRKPAEDGALVLLASGPEDVRDRLEPVFAAIARKTLWLDGDGAGTRLKLVCNAWIFMLTAGVAQSVALARALDVDPRHFFAAIEGGPLDTPYAHVKGALIRDGEYPVSFALPGAIKDNRLIQAALASAGLSDRLTAAVLETMEAAASGLTDPASADMAVMVEGLSRSRD